MPTDWTEQDVMEHAKELKSPFDEVKQKQGTILPNLARIRDAIRNRGIKK